MPRLRQVYGHDGLAVRRRPIDGTFARHRRRLPVCDAANRRMTTMRGWRLATVCGHVGVPLFRRHSNGFEVPTTMDDHVDRVAVRKKNHAPSEWHAVAWFWRISNAWPVDELRSGALGSVEVTESCPNLDLTLYRFKVYRESSHRADPMIPPKPNKCRV